MKNRSFYLSKLKSNNIGEKYNIDFDEDSIFIAPCWGLSVKIGSVFLSYDDRGSRHLWRVFTCSKRYYPEHTIQTDKSIMSDYIGYRMSGRFINGVRYLGSYFVDNPNSLDDAVSCAIENNSLLWLLLREIRFTFNKWMGV